MKGKILLLALVLALVSASSCQKKEILFQQGKGEMEYTCTTADGEKNIHLFYYIPEGDIAKMPVQIVMHGMGRNGSGYFNVWVEQADKYGFIVLTPTFSEEQFAEESYQQGNIMGPDGKFNKKEDMTYTIVDDIFEYFLDHSESKAKKFNIYGHSAGAQFVHRYLMFGDPKVDAAVAANSGWYTFPTDTTAFPYGIGDAEKELSLNIADYYSKELTILLGDADTLRTSNLRQTPEADAQGLHRLARGESFYSFCQKDAETRGVPFNWKKAYVNGSNHSNGKMAPKAAEVIYGNK